MFKLPAILLQSAEYKSSESFTLLHGIAIIRLKNYDIEYVCRRISMKIYKIIGGKNYIKMAHSYFRQKINNLILIMKKFCSPTSLDIFNIMRLKYSYCGVTLSDSSRFCGEVMGSIVPIADKSDVRH